MCVGPVALSGGSWSETRLFSPRLSRLADILRFFGGLGLAAVTARERLPCTRFGLLLLLL